MTQKTDERTLENIASEVKALANAIQIDMDDPGKLLVADYLFDRCRDLAEEGCREAMSKAESLLEGVWLNAPSDPNIGG
jgi:hypothetical protein